MWTCRILFLLACAGGIAVAQNTPPGASGDASPAVQRPAGEPENAAARAMHRRFDLLAARSIAYFRVADTLDENLMAQGMGLSSETLVLRLRLETELDRIGEALERGDLTAAAKSLDRGQALLDRLASKLGG